MSKGAVNVDWVVCNSQADWVAAQAQESAQGTAPAQRPARQMRRVWIAALALLLILTGSGVWVWRTAQAGLDQIGTELNAAVSQELWAIRAGRPEFAAELATGSRDSSLQTQLQGDYAFLEKLAADASATDATIADIEIVRLHNDMAVVRVTFDIEDKAFRQTRFYRRTPEGWLQISPEPVLLGEWKLLQTEYVSVGHFEIDAVAVAEAAPRLDAFVAQVRTDVGLPLDAGQSRSVIEVIPDLHSSQRYIQETDLNRRTIYVTSPSLTLLPDNTTESDAIVQATALSLVYPLAEEALDQHGTLWDGSALRWIPLISALRLWEFWESGAPLAMWKDEIVALDMQGWVQPGQSPPFYKEICDAYGAWNLSPMSMSIPLTCEPAQREPYLASPMPDTLHGLLAAGINCCAPEDCCAFATTPMLESYTVGLATVLDYVVATYGREQLPVLVGALGEHKTWESLIPAVFGVPMGEFEQGWQEYIKARYGSR